MASTIILSDNGASSGSAGLKQTAGNDGVLILQTTTSGGTATNAIYVDAKQNSGFGVTPSSWESGGKVIQMDLSGAGGTSGNSFNIWARSDSARMWVGAYFDGSAYYRQATGVVPTNLSIDSTGGLAMQSAPSGTAGTTFTNPNITAFFSLKKDNTLALQGGTQSSGTGIAFPATQSSSSDAQTLDDYEEGTWTPTFTATGYTFTQSASIGVYTKIGRVVTWSTYVTVTYASGSGTVVGTLTGLPFTASSSNANYGGIGVCPDVGSAYLTSGGYGQMCGRVGPSSSSVYVFVGGGGLGLKTTFNWAGMSANTEFELSGTYITNT